MPEAKSLADVVSQSSGQAKDERSGRSATEREFVRGQLRRIAGLIDKGLNAEAREAGAALMLDHQALLASRPELSVSFADLLRRCEATVLRRRFMLAVYGDTPAIPTSAARGRASRVVTAGAYRQAPAAASASEMAVQDD